MQTLTFTERVEQEQGKEESGKHHPAAWSWTPRHHLRHKHKHDRQSIPKHYSWAHTKLVILFGEGKDKDVALYFKTNNNT